MPELPEVETIVRDLAKHLKNKTIIAIDWLDKKVFKLSSREVKRVIGKKIRSVSRRAKMIIIDLGGDYLIIHLKMTGQLVFESKHNLIAGGHPIINQNKKLPNKFTRVIFKFSGRGILYFNDVRRFGWIKLAGRADFLKFNQSLGIEPLSSDFTLAYFNKVLRLKTGAAIKPALLDQKYIAGIGNIYADEALYVARLKPFRRVKTLTPQETKKLWQAILKVLTRAIKYRGTSFSDFVDAQGRNGNFIKYLKVYGRGGQKCKNCGRRIKKMKLGGRGTHWCDFCQK